MLIKRVKMTSKMKIQEEKKTKMIQKKKEKKE
jgi:hypothetical protein